MSLMTLQAHRGEYMFLRLGQRSDPETSTVMEYQMSPIPITISLMSLTSKPTLCMIQ